MQVGNNFYFYPVGGSSGPLFKYGGSPVAVGQFPVELSSGRSKRRADIKSHSVVAGTDLYTVWNTDSSGNFVSNGTGGVIVSGSSSVLKSLEPSFQQDLNGDGLIGSAAAPKTVIESFGSTSLVQVGNNFYFYPVGGSSGPLFKYGGSAVAVGQFPVELHRGGANGERLSSRTSCRRHGSVHGLEHRQQWQFRFQRDRGVVVSGSSSVIKSLEPSFQQDLNGDGVIGSAPAPKTVIGSFGSTSLVQVGNNLLLHRRRQHWPAVRTAARPSRSGSFRELSRG